jgi:CRISPR/Cas system CSM-associated protein Csm3 (group 7 of RAMP superfamily)
VEDDYLGGVGSRGSGKVKFENLAVRVKAGRDGWQTHTLAEKVPGLAELALRYGEWRQQAQQLILAA